MDQRWWLPLKRNLGADDYAYLHFLPPGYTSDGSQKHPLLLYLHGSGERGNDLEERGDDLEKLKANGPPKLAADGRTFPFVVIAPQCPAGEWWSAPQLKKLVDRAIVDYHADPDRIYVTGLSMGGYGAWELVDEYPDLAAAVVPICGAGAPHDAPRVKHVPAWLFHGADDTVVSPRHSTEMHDALKAAGGDVRLTIYPDTGHDAWSRAYDTPELYEWLLKQTRSPAGLAPAGGR
jgi:predicted peptidase